MSATENPLLDTSRHVLGGILAHCLFRSNLAFVMRRNLYRYIPEMQVLRTSGLVLRISCLALIWLGFSD
jgi:hypothetical protein